MCLELVKGMQSFKEQHITTLPKVIFFFFAGVGNALIILTGLEYMYHAKHILKHNVSHDIETKLKTSSEKTPQSPQ